MAEELGVVVDDMIFMVNGVVGNHGVWFTFELNWVRS